MSHEASQTTSKSINHNKNQNLHITGQGVEQRKYSVFYYSVVEHSYFGCVKLLILTPVTSIVLKIAVSQVLHIL